MRLLIVSSEFPPGPGGIGTHAFQLARGLTGHGWTVSVLTAQDYVGESDLRRFNRRQSFNITTFPRRANSTLTHLNRLSTLLRTWRSFRPDWIIATGLTSVWMVSMLGLIARQRWLAVAHGGEVEFGGRRMMSLTRWAYSSPQLTTSVSRYTEQRLQDLGINPRRSIVINNGADASLAAHVEGSGFRRRWGLPGARILLTVGNVSHRKGQDVVIRSLPHLLQRGLDVHYVVVGLPTMKSEFGELAKTLGVEDRLHFTGVLDDDELKDAYDACDLFIMTSRTTSDGRFEGFGIAVAEAALFGKPSVVSDNSGLMEAIVDGQTGVAVPQDDPVATAEAVSSLLSSKDLLSDMGRAALRHARTRQTWKSVAGRYAAAIESFDRSSAEQVSEVT